MACPKWKECLVNTLALLLLSQINLTTAQDGMSIQTQIYVISGVYGGALLLLIILVLILALSLGKLRYQLDGDMERYVPAEINPSNSQQQQIFAYENGAFNGVTELGEMSAGMRERSVDGDDELERMGYTVYSENRHNRPSSPGDIGAGLSASRPVLNYEEGVIPLQDRGERVDQRDRGERGVSRLDDRARSAGRGVPGGRGGGVADKYA